MSDLEKKKIRAQAIHQGNDLFRKLFNLKDALKADLKMLLHCEGVEIIEEIKDSEAASLADLINSQIENLSAGLESLNDALNYLEGLTL